MAKTYVDNRNSEHSRECMASDGQTVQVGPGAKRAPIDDKFLWKKHPDVVLSGNSVRTFKTADEEAKDKAAAEKTAADKTTENEELRQQAEKEKLSTSEEKDSEASPIHS